MGKIATVNILSSQCDGIKIRHLSGTKMRMFMLVWKDALTASN